jgi:hypothetical protein
MTAATLKAYTVKDLAQLAKKHGVDGWHSMRKEQLVRALVRASKRRTAKVSKSHPKLAKKSAVPARRAVAKRARPLRRPVVRKAPTAAAASRSKKRLEQAKSRLHQLKSLATDNGTGKARDRLVLMVRGPYWLHAYWELGPRGVVRAQAALGQDWHAAKPVLRLMVAASGAATAERVVREIEIHGGVRNWYIDVSDPPQTYRAEIGYLAPTGRFFSLARSNVVSTPAAASSNGIDTHWSDVIENCDKIYAMSGGFSPESNVNELQELFEERLHRPMGAPSNSHYGVGAEALAGRDRRFRFDIDAEIVIHGSTQPDSHVTLQGEPIKLRPDGGFSVRLDLPNRRQVIPIVARSKDGIEQRTIIVAVERNTKVMEPVINDTGE